jgi:hypothetical protein
MCIKCAQTHLRASAISKKFPGLQLGLPLKREGLPEEEWEERGGEVERRVKGAGGEGNEGRGAPTLRCLISHPDRKSWINPWISSCDGCVRTYQIDANESKSCRLLSIK